MGCTAASESDSESSCGGREAGPGAAPTQVGRLSRAASGNTGRPA